MIDRLQSTRHLLLFIVLILALVACGPAQDAQEELATLTAVAEQSSSAPAEVEAEDTPAPAQAEVTAEQESVAGVEDGGFSFDIYGGTPKSEFSTSDSGLQYYFYQEGDGVPAQDGQLLMINVMGWLEDGTEITNSAAFGGPIPLPVGSSTGLIGLDEALAMLGTGSSVRLIIPGELAVAEDGSPSGLPPGVIVFDMEVVEIIDGPPDAPQVVEDSAYTETGSGLKYADLTEGDGAEVEAGQQVAVHYTGWLEDNTIFDSSIGRQPFTLVVGQGQVIPGWDEGLQGMKVGGIRQLVIPPDLAYGESGSGSIPPNSVLIFEVEVVSAE